jgi:hypothetical protein
VRRFKPASSTAVASGRSTRVHTQPAVVQRELPKVMVIINTTFGDGDSLLSGISRFQRERGAWDVFVDHDAIAESDPRWLCDQTWNGIISRTTSPALVEFCAERNLPLVDVNDCPAFEGVLKIRPDNIAVGHMAAEDIYERGYRHLYYCGYGDQDWSNERRDGFMEALRLLDCEAQDFSLSIFAEPRAPRTMRLRSQNSLRGWKLSQFRLASWPRMTSSVGRYSRRRSGLAAWCPTTSR